MSGVTFEYMEKYLRDLIPERNDELKELEDFAKENKGANNTKGRC